VQNVAITLCSFFLAARFTLLWRNYLLLERRRSGDETQEAVEKMSNRAGATPLFRLPAAQKVFGVAPALRHRFLCRTFFPRLRVSERSQFF
jgi:hypothetical protein